MERAKIDWAGVEKLFEKHDPKADHRFPHCDPLILHQPGTCHVCDMHPDWQALRIAWEINFTGESDPQKSPCPSQKYRPAYQAHQWPNNRPDVEVPLRPPTAWEHLNEDDADEPG